MTDIIQPVTSVIQTVAVVISLIYVAIQIRDSTKSVKSQTYQAIISSYAEIEARIGQDHETARIFSLGSKNPEQLNEEESVRFRQLICSIFNFYENLYYQYKTGLLEPSLWAGWCRTMRKQLEKKGISEYWDESRCLYSKDFCEYVRSKKCPKN